jgi:hypothetical protein
MPPPLVSNPARGAAAHRRPRNCWPRSWLVYSPNQNLAIGFGFTKGLNSASQDWSCFSGFVVPLARRW